MSHFCKVSLSGFLGFPQQAITWNENRYDNRNRIGVICTWITDLILLESLVFHTHRFQLKGALLCSNLPMLTLRTDRSIMGQ